MHITECSDMDTFSSPNTALGLSLSPPTPPASKDIPPLNHSFNHPPAGPLLNFLNISKSPPASIPTVLRNHNNTVPARSSPPFQLELLPLKPSPQKPSFSPPQPQLLHWQQPPAVMPPTSISSNSYMRGIDVNQLPSVYVDRDEISESCGLPNAMKRERERSSDAEQERTCEVSSRGSDEEGEGGNAKKKLRLSKEQSTLLEESFQEHSTLNTKQKGELSRQLNLRPRQVEVWFQNRRARTKLKQTEVDCELLKRCCESLTEENRRLQKEVQELRAIKVAPPCVISPDRFMPLPAASLSICPSCERVASHVPRLAPAASTQPCPSSALSFSLSPAPIRQVHPHHLPLAFLPPPQPPAQHALPSAAC